MRRSERDRRRRRPGSSAGTGSSSRLRASSRAATHPSKSPASKHACASSRRRVAVCACDSTNRAVSRTWAAAHAAFARSSASMPETRSASSRPVLSRRATSRSSVDVTPSGVPAGAPGEPATSSVTSRAASNMCAILGVSCEPHNGYPHRIRLSGNGFGVLAAMSVLPERMSLVIVSYRDRGRSRQRPTRGSRPRRRTTRRPMSSSPSRRSVSRSACRPGPRSVTSTKPCRS